MKNKFITTALIGLLIGVGVSTAQASVNTVTGHLWHVSEATSQNAIPANVPGSTPDVTFQVNSPMNFFGTSATVGTWLGNGFAN